VGRNNCDLSLIGEPPCWGSGELPLLPQSWARALRKISLNSIVKDLGNGLEWQSDKRVKSEELCGVDWASKVKNLKSVDRSFRVGDLIISALCKENFDDSTALDIPIVELNLAGIPGGSKVPLQIKTRDALIAVGLFSDDGINELLSGTYLELIQRLKDLAVVLDFAITTTAWLKRGPLDENIVFQVPETSETMTEAFRTMRMRVVRNIGYSPEASFYQSNFADVLGKRFGFDWQGKWTLDECGEDLGLTRERLRQIEKKAQLSFSSRQWGDSPALRNAIHELLAHAGNEFYFTDTDKRVLWVDRNAIEYLLIKSGVDQTKFQNLNRSEYAQAEFGQSISEMRREAYKYSGKIGFAIEEDIRSHFKTLYENFDDAKFDQVKSLIAEKLDLPHGYLYVEPKAKTFFLSWTQNIFSLQGDLQFDEFFDASHRYCTYRLPGVVHPPRSVIRSWLQSDERFNIDEQDTVSIIEPVEVKLGQTQQWLRNEIISATGCVAHRAELMDRAREANINAASIGVYCSYERYFKPLDTYCVTLTGMYPTKEFIDLAYMRAANLKVETVIEDFKVEQDLVTVVVTAGSNMCNQGFWSLNKPLETAVGARNFELVVDGAPVGRSTYFGSTATGWTSALAALGVVPGDKVKIEFNTKLLIASLEVQRDISDLDDSD